MKRILLSVLFIYCSSAIAIDVYTNYEERLGEAGKLVSLDGDEAFGAKIDPATGATSFYVPVLSIPGSRGLDITVVYKLDVRNDAGSTKWYFEQDEPYVGGSFSQELGWLTYSGSASRCSQATAGSKPPRVQSSEGRDRWFEPDEYWSGYQLSLPGGGGASLDRLGASPVPVPSVGAPFYWSANDHWFFSCIPLVSGTGEGYLGLSPDGLKYHFNTMRSSYLSTLNKFDAGGKDLYLDRYEIRIYAGKIEDRFGNYVTGLTASDGRAVTKTVSGSIVTFKYGTRQWTVNTAGPYTVTYPDGSQWKATVTGSIYDVTMVNKSCPSEIPAPSPATTTATINSPSGATGTYLFKQIKIGYSYVSNQCVGLDDGSVVSVHPNYFARTSLVQRTISGPGLATSTLSINYGTTNNCFTNASPTCTSTSPTTRVVTHTETGGKFKRYTYGNRSGVNADLLLKLEEGQSNSVLRTTEFGYTLLPKVGGYAGSNYSTALYFPSSSKRVVTVSRTIKEAGMIFDWKVSPTCGTSGTGLCIDAFGRPTKVTKSSRPGT